MKTPKGSISDESSASLELKQSYSKFNRSSTYEYLRGALFTKPAVIDDAAKFSPRAIEILQLTDYT